MKKKQGIKILAFGIISLLTYQIYGSDKRPNILFAFGDDMTRVQSIYHTIEGGKTLNSTIQTPNFDKLAKDGVLFMNAHVNAPQCTPCRSSLLTGQYFWRTGRGAILQGAVWEDSIPSFPVILKENGYHIGYTYKVWYPGIPANAPFTNEERYENRGRNFCFFSETIFEDNPGNQLVELRKKELFDEVTGNFEDFLADRDEGQPFCYWWGPWNTHRPWVRGSGEKLWNIDPDDLQDVLPPTLANVPEVREDIADYLGECVAFDYGLGLLISKLEEMGELDNTLIVVSGDHGMPFPRAKSNLYDQGTHVPLAIRYPSMIYPERTVDDFVNLIDLAPTFLEIAGIHVPEVMTGKSLIPILKAKRSGMINPENDYVVTGFERHVASARAGRTPYPHRAITKMIDGKKFKYIRNFRPHRWPAGNLETNFPDVGNGITKTWYIENYCNPDYQYYIDLAFAKRPYEELYELDSDPFELKNLEANPGLKSIKDKLSDELERILIDTNDPRMVEGGQGISKFDRFPFTVPHI